MGNVHFINDDGVSIWGRVGPSRYNDFINVVPRRMLVPDLVRFVTDQHANNNNDDTVLLPQLQILAVSFLKSQIKGILPLLEDTTGERSVSGLGRKRQRQQQ